MLRKYKYWMSTKINLATYLQPYVGNKETVEVNGITVEDCIKDLTKQFPAIKTLLIDEEGKVLPYVNTFLNDEIIYPDELSTPVKDNDEIYLLYMIDGG